LTTGFEWHNIDGSIGPQNSTANNSSSPETLDDDRSDQTARNANRQDRPGQDPGQAGWHIGHLTTDRWPTDQRISRYFGIEGTLINGLRAADQ
jgi:hypothetical protein